MMEKLKKVNNICGAVLFVLILLITITSLINAIAMPWIGKLMDDIGRFQNYYITVYLTNMSWGLFSFGVFALVISICNYFTKNRYKYIETIYLSLFLVFIVVITILLKPLTYLDITTVKAEVISAFSTFMIQIFILVLYLISRILQFWVLKPEEQILPIVRQKSRKRNLVVGILSLSVAVVSLVSSLTLFILPYSLTDFTIEYDHYNEAYIKYNSDKKLVNVYLRYIYKKNSDTYYGEHFQNTLAPGGSFSYNYQIFYEVEGLEGALPSALSIMPLALASSMFAIQWIVTYKKKEDEHVSEKENA